MGGGVIPDNQPDGQIIQRTSQNFSNVGQWGNGYMVDNASSTWVLPVTSSYNNPQPGTLAVEDYWSEEDSKSPLITATVKAVTTVEDDIVIGLRVDDLDADSFTAEFYAPEIMTGSEDVICRHPSVEVAYCRLTSSVGLNFVYIAWSQLSKVNNSENWDLYGAAYVFEVTLGESGDIDLDDPLTSIIVPLDNTQSNLYGQPGDEVQPDLALLSNGDLVVAYVETFAANFNQSIIKAMRLDYNPLNPLATPEQMDIVQVSSVLSGNPTSRDISPSLDVGCIISIDDDEEFTAFCAWFRDLVNNPNQQPPDGYRIQYAYWAALDDPSSASTPATMTPDSGEANALVTVDITPSMTYGGTTIEDYPYHEVILAWTNFQYDTSGVWPEFVQQYEDPIIQIMVAPEGDATQFDEDTSYGIAPDIACYERPTGAEQWWGVSYYEADTGGDVGDWDWDGTQIKSYSFDDDYDITPQDETYISIQPAFWWLGVPFTSSSLCLRDPSITDINTPPEPIYDVFAIAKIQGDATQTSVYIGEGTIE